MLQVDHVYEFFYKSLFKNDFEVWSCLNGVIELTDNIGPTNTQVLMPGHRTTKKIFFYDQEPILPDITEIYLDAFNWPSGLTADEVVQSNRQKAPEFSVPDNIMEFLLKHPKYLYKENSILVTSEMSPLVNDLVKKYNFNNLYYFFHGFAALDWYRGFYALNYNKPVVKQYKRDYVSFNRLITNDRAYRIYFMAKLIEYDILHQGSVSFDVSSETDTWCDELNNPHTKLTRKEQETIKKVAHVIKRLVVDSSVVPGSASADILRNTNIFETGEFFPEADCFWHIVTETVFYYDKLHLTEKIFKPIVSKQPFMLVAAPGNLAYLKSYGFKTFDSIIDESYDSITDNTDRINHITAQLNWYCNLSIKDKLDVARAIEPIVEYNFHHFYNEFKSTITNELISNCQTLFKEINYDDSKIDYQILLQALIN